jgi:conjugative transfer signal peptidase TraF
MIHKQTMPLRIRARSPLTLGVIAVLIVGVSAVWRGPILILWNASASVPVGLYAVLPKAAIHDGNLAVVDLPVDTRDLAAQRRYLPPGVLLIKPVAAETGERVCRRGYRIYINDAWAADAKSADVAHRPLPDWQGCRLLSKREVFLMNRQVRDSFDGRYFGPIDMHLSHGRAWPLLTFPAHQNR